MSIGFWIKECINCGKEFKATFNTMKICSDSCRKERLNKQHREYDKKRDKTEKRRLQKQKWWLSDKRKQSRKKYYEQERIKNLEWCKNNHDKIKEYWRKSSIKKRSTENGKLISNIRSYTSRSIRGYKFKKAEELLGCSYTELKKYIGNLLKNGMTWDNYGKWHIDHIIPISSFDLSNIDNQKSCFNYKNLQPLWAKDNLVKYNKIPK